MSHVLNYGGQYFRIEITEVISPDLADKPLYVAWYSDAFKSLKDLPGQSLSRFVAGPQLATYADALRYVCDGIKATWDEKQTKQPAKDADPSNANVMYTVWLFEGEASTGFDFENYQDATAFAKAAESIVPVTKIGITNNESPKYLTMWEKPKGVTPKN